MKFYVKYSDETKKKGIKVLSEIEIEDLVAAGYEEVSKEEFEAVAFAPGRPLETPSEEADMMQLLLDQEYRLTVLELATETAEI